MLTRPTNRFARELTAGHVPIGLRHVPSSEARRPTLRPTGGQQPDRHMTRPCCCASSGTAHPPPGPSPQPLPRIGHHRPRRNQEHTSTRDADTREHRLHRRFHLPHSALGVDAGRQHTRDRHVADEPCPSTRVRQAPFGGRAPRDPNPGGRAGTPADPRKRGPVPGRAGRCPSTRQTTERKAGKRRQDATLSSGVRFAR